jgi:hypothetical protein
MAGSTIGPEWRIVAVRHRADRLIKHDVVGQGVRASRAVSALAVLEIHPKGADLSRVMSQRRQVVIRQTHLAAIL